MRLKETDAAGVVYFNQPLNYAHETYEAFLDATEFSVAAVIREGQFALPIIDVKMSQKAPLRVGDDVDITMSVEKVGDTSVVTVFAMTTARGTHAAFPVGTARFVHVAIDRGTGQPCALPTMLADAFREILAPVVSA